ncbi:hypothetical protein CAOG_05115 [Capsaspora owczarzaki ATCC 30864]|uniref:MARVEL domain-containing protein n=1 Tax=Capsaspora owczarzaki (strain ATCC 30864) TaxID=595528 RepID=A0A0D2WRF9_CAPO3|nr:hypothetical protein CAOG_05115 [Capsaspora owczarzaki ATCC 30864]KJE94480.1 hypothetical protein CAOG_005115 [Capsaspora owczarzaki ATCC 30864]|eukprot:XP_004346800.1 hypothetical protein CAOG_05115 [Capsaspora owczarzaki ATCC 30864]
MVNISTADLREPRVFLYIIVWFLAMISFGCVAGPDYRDSGSLAGACPGSFKYDSLDAICNNDVIGKSSWKSSGVFMVAIGVIVFIWAFVMTVAHVVFPSKLPLSMPIIELGVNIAMVFLFIIASAVWAKTVSDIGDELTSFGISFTTWRAGAAFGFLSTFALLALAVFIALSIRRGAPAAAPAVV